MRLSARAPHTNDGATGTVILDFIVRTDVAALSTLRKSKEKRNELYNLY